MYKNVLQAIDGIEIYPLISFGIFFLFFLGLLVYVFLLDKKHVEVMSQVPCGKEEEHTTTGGLRQ
ncbi:hypothetical protein CLV24_109151 [Pontibacter ummariensis]|uniref:Cbb3-type cytochrome oxidase component FixQ n=1 Tax=Pontibacter ummariensis TaxID=1610492 RepID=A0A239FKZ0_9BACT|nr:hypothetical protein [Pontibacter ummariensis]PRY12026.1 hypothetical protein CLV24_109151 [Pontibacter ummariensis]SNS57576.1 hypothetical protein SAMN06296052_10919 [Pontibacter ummariensis]